MKPNALLRAGTELLFPAACVICGSFAGVLCPVCRQFLQIEKKQICLACNQPSPNGATHPDCRPSALDGFLCCGKFSQIQPLVHAYKYERASELDLPLAEFILEFLKRAELLDFFSAFLLTFVPLSSFRQRERGYNQSELLAQRLSGIALLPILEKGLTRQMDTKPQVKLGKEERTVNVRGAFGVDSKLDLKDKNILLLDDIATTGATLNECAKTLKRAGAKAVWALVLARG
ncbi:MAG: ComF family protein [Candidatus Doudnabacteria bacterium]|nr:ComF family protein [Candidatus Doudnabacteria bacterium]